MVLLEVFSDVVNKESKGQGEVKHSSREMKRIGLERKTKERSEKILKKKKCRRTPTYSVFTRRGDNEGCLAALGRRPVY